MPVVAKSPMSLEVLPSILSRTLKDKNTCKKNLALRQKRKIKPDGKFVSGVEGKSHGKHP
jgi:hypothetical protein